MGRLRLNVETLARLKGVPSLHGFLTANGISKHTATELSAGRMNRIDLEVLLKLCIAFKCPVEDLILYEPSNEAELETHPYLKGMVKKADYLNVIERLAAIDGQKLKLLDAFLKGL